MFYFAKAPFFKTEICFFALSVSRFAFRISRSAFSVQRLAFRVPHSALSLNRTFAVVTMEKEIINKVSQSALLTLDLEPFFPKEEIRIFDLKPFLFMELILKEKDFRNSLSLIEWSEYKDTIVGVCCTADAIIPVWAYMLVTSYLQPFAKEVIMGTEADVLRQVITTNIQLINPQDYKDKRVVVKGCGDVPMGDFAYLEITKLLRPVVKSIMYGEPCSTVPIYKAESLRPKA